MTQAHKVCGFKRRNLTGKSFGRFSTVVSEPGFWDSEKVIQNETYMARGIDDSL